MLRSLVRTAPAIWLATVALAAGPVRAESALLLDRPDSVGTVPASTYDLDRARVGEAHLVMEALDEGRLRMFNDSGFTGGARTVMTAVLAPTGGERKLRPVFQESRSFDGGGNALGVLTVDHVEGVARCAAPDGETVHVVPLPARDRVANVALNLFFLPLVRGETDKLTFQLFLCSAGGRLVDFVANVVGGSGNGNGSRRAIEVRYGPDFGIASLVARSFVPKLSLWFDPASPHGWVGHRVPLYGKGPEVYVVRDGYPVDWLSDD